MTVLAQKAGRARGIVTAAVSLVVFAGLAEMLLAQNALGQNLGTIGTGVAGRHVHAVWVDAVGERAVSVPDP